MDLFGGENFSEVNITLKSFIQNRFERQLYDEIKVKLLENCEKLEDDSDVKRQHHTGENGVDRDLISPSHIYYWLGKIYNFGLGSTTSNLRRSYHYYKLSAEMGHPVAIYRLGQLTGYQDCGYTFVKRLKNAKQTAYYRVRQYVASAAMDPWCCQSDTDLTQLCQENKFYFLALCKLKQSHTQIITQYEDDSVESLINTDKINGSIYYPYYYRQCKRSYKGLNKWCLTTIYCQLGYITLKLNQLNGENYDDIAMKYFTIAAKYGDPCGYYNIAMWKYTLGYFGPIDQDKSIEYFIKASRFNYPPASYHLTKYYYHRLISTLNQVYIKLALDQSVIAIRYAFASPLFYYAALCFVQDNQVANGLYFLKRSVIADDYIGGHGAAMSYLNLGYLYKIGKIVKVDFCVAGHCFSSAALLGENQGLIEAGKLVEKGKVTTSDTNTTIRLYRTAATSSDSSIATQAHGMKRLAQMYAKMKTTQANNMHRARQYITQSITKFTILTNDPVLGSDANYQIGRMYHKGLATGVQDRKAAIQCYRRINSRDINFIWLQTGDKFVIKSRKRLEEIELERKRNNGRNDVI